jgi:hypothetical protein
MSQTDTAPNWAERYETMRRNRGEPAQQIDEERFDYLLCVLPPAHWTRGREFSCFMVDECQTADLFTWCARLTENDLDTFWELIAPENSTPSEILSKVYTAQRLAA